MSRTLILSDIMVSLNSRYIFRQNKIAVIYYQYQYDMSDVNKYIIQEIKQMSKNQGSR